MGFIYKITNTVNGKSYIGQTIQKPEKRINNHFYPGGSGCTALHNAIQKSGRDAFTVEILHEVLDIFLDDLEIAEIKRYNTLVPNGYNLDSGGNANKVVSDETRQKMSEARKGCKRNPCSPETRKKISDAHKSRTHTPEARKNMSDAHKGKTLSPEHRKKMSEALKGRTISPEARKNMSEAAKKRKPQPVSLETRQKMSEAHKGKTLSPETRQKMSEAHKRRKPVSLETRQKMSEAAKKRKPASLETRQKMSEAHKGKTFSLETRQKLSEIKAHPDRPKAYEFLNTLPAHMSLAERHKALQNKFPRQPRYNIYRWVKQWTKASST